MNAPSVDIEDLLAASSTGLTSGTDLFVSAEPDGGDIADKVVSIYDVPGLEPETYADLYYPNIMIRIRGDKAGFVAGEALAQVVRDTLHAVKNTTVNSTRYVQIIASTEIGFLGYDTKNRPAWSINFRIIRTA